MRQLGKRFLEDEGGATAIEYALVVALISVAIVATLSIIGVKLVEKFQDVADALFST